MQVKFIAIVAIVLVAQHVQAGTISFGGLMGDVSKVAVAGEKAIHNLENQVGGGLPQVGYVQPATQNLLGDMANGLGDLANALTNLRVENDFVKPENYNLIGSLLGDMANALGDLANLITSLNVEIHPENLSVSSAGASAIGEINGVSAKAIASAAQAAAPYVKQMNQALGDLANSLTNLRVESSYVKPESYNVIGNLMGDMGDALGNLANTITSLSVVQPKTSSISTAGATAIGEINGVSAKTIASAAQAAAPYVNQVNQALGDLANTITGAKVETKTSSISTAGATAIGEINGASAKAIASAARAAAPYVKQMNQALGDLANALTNL